MLKDQVSGSPAVGRANNVVCARREPGRVWDHPNCRVALEVDAGMEMLRRPRAKIIMLMCGACKLPSGAGVLPGLIVSKMQQPPRSVSRRPKPWNSPDPAESSGFG